MPGYVDLLGHQIWSYQYENNGEPIVVLHGGLSHSEKILPYLLPALSATKTVYAYDRSGHGRTAYREGAFDMNHQRDELIHYLERVVREGAHLIGHSDGANCAVMVALKRPDLVRSLVAIGPALTPADLVAQLPQNLTPSAEDQAEHGALSPDAPEMLQRKLSECLAMWGRDPQITASELSTLSAPTLFMQGDDDVIANTTAELYAKSVPDGRLCIIAGASHDVIKEKTGLVQASLQDFYANLDYPKTKYPNWRQ